MFKIADISPTYWATVKALIPIDDDHFKEWVFKVEFNRISEEDLEGLSPFEQAKKITASWDDVPAEGGGLVPFSDENFENLLRRNGQLGMAVRQAIITTYVQKQAGARRGN